MRPLLLAAASLSFAHAAAAAPSVTAGGFALAYQYRTNPFFTGFSLQVEGDPNTIAAPTRLTEVTYSLDSTFGDAHSRASARPGRLRVEAETNTPAAQTFDPTESNDLLINSFAYWTEETTVRRARGGAGTFRGSFRITSSLSALANSDATDFAPLPAGGSSDSSITAQLQAFVTAFPDTSDQTRVFEAWDALASSRNISESGGTTSPFFYSSRSIFIARPSRQNIPNINTRFTFSIPITFNTPFQFQLGLVCNAGSIADTAQVAATVSGAARCQAGRSLEWDGAEVLDADGDPIALSTLTIESASGFDLTAPFADEDVPAPAALALFGLGAALVIRRRALAG